MIGKNKISFVNTSLFKWQNFLILAVILFYLVLLSTWFGKGFDYGTDFLSFWSEGKIANQKGYSAIYDLSTLKSTEIDEMQRVNPGMTIDPASFSTMPAPFFAFFVLPFQLFALLGLDVSFWVWTTLNLVILIGYLVFFLRQTLPDDLPRLKAIYFLCLMLCAYPVLANIANGQVEVFLVVCTGEFIRNGLKDRPFVSGLWVGGLLLKPQIMILIVPVLLILRYWKAFGGFLLSSVLILLSSLFLSGISGFVRLAQLWTGQSGAIAAYSPGAMINWRMLGLNINSWSNSSLGWWVTGIGTLLTLAALSLLLKRRPAFGSPEWVLCMLGVFSATLVTTWHSHYHMALAILPLLLYTIENKLLSENIVAAWSLITPVFWFLFVMMVQIIDILFPNSLAIYQGLGITLCGFILTQLLLITLINNTQ